MKKTIDLALDFISSGWPLIPVYGVHSNGNCECGNSSCRSAGKHPKTKNGSKDATLDETAIRRFCQSPLTNLGIATGPCSGLMVLDIDPRHGGNVSIQELEQQFGLLPKTVTVRTGSEGGFHKYFKYPAVGVKNKANLRPGIDIRGDGGYVVAPGSRHASGKYYEFEAELGISEIAVAPAPEWLIALLTSNPSKPPETMLISEGSRNDQLFKIAASLRNSGLTGSALESELLVHNKERCVPPLTEGEVRTIAQNVEKYSSDSKNKNNPAIHWKVPKPIPATEVEAPAIPPELIPAPIRDYVLDCAERMQASPEMITVSMLVCLGALIGRRLTIKPKKYDNWIVVSNLWGAIIAVASAMKTPAMGAALHLTRKLEAEAKTRFLTQMAEYASREAEHKNSPEKHSNKFSELPPIRSRFIVNDSTTEKLGVLLNENPYGLLVFRDELLGLLLSMEKPGKEGDRQFFLEAFNGNGSFTVDRLGRGTTEIQALCLSILGGIQPDRICSYFEQAIKNGSGDDGFLARFQLLVYPVLSKHYQLIDRKPDYHAHDRVLAIFRKITEIDFIFHGFAKEEREDCPYARFNDEAQELFYSWLEKHEIRMRSGTIESAALEAHLAKYKKLMPALALIFHIVDFFDPTTTNIKKPIDISLESAKMAAAWCDFLEAHAKKVYGDAQRAGLVAAEALSKKILCGDVADRTAVRNIYRKEWARLATAEQVRKALIVLESCNWVQVIEESVTGKGAPTEVVYLNPEILKRVQK